MAAIRRRERDYVQRRRDLLDEYQKTLSEYSKNRLSAQAFPLHVSVTESIVSAVVTLLTLDECVILRGSTAVVRFSPVSQLNEAALVEQTIQRDPPPLLPFSLDFLASILPQLRTPSPDTLCTVFDRLAAAAHQPCLETVLLDGVLSLIQGLSAALQNPSDTLLLKKLDIVASCPMGSDIKGWTTLCVPAPVPRLLQPLQDEYIDALRSARLLGRNSATDAAQWLPAVREQLLPAATIDMGPAFNAVIPGNPIPFVAGMSPLFSLPHCTALDPALMLYQTVHTPFSLISHSLREKLVTQLQCGLTDSVRDLLRIVFLFHSSAQRDALAAAVALPIPMPQGRLALLSADAAIATAAADFCPVRKDSLVSLRLRFAAELSSLPQVTRVDKVPLPPDLAIWAHAQVSLMPGVLPAAVLSSRLVAAKASQALCLAGQIATAEHYLLSWRMPTRNYDEKRVALFSAARWRALCLLRSLRALQAVAAEAAVERMSSAFVSQVAAGKVNPDVLGDTFATTLGDAVSDSLCGGMVEQRRRVWEAVAASAALGRALLADDEQNVRILNDALHSAELHLITISQSSHASLRTQEALRVLGIALRPFAQDSVTL